MKKWILVSMVAGLLSLPSAPAPGQAPPQSPSTRATSAVPKPGDAVLTLPVATRRFVERNLAVEAARLKVSAATAERVGVRLLPRPTVTLNADNMSVGGPTPFSYLHEFGVFVTQPLELGPRRAIRAEMAERTVEVAETRLNSTLRTRLCELRRAYYETLLAREMVAVASDNRIAFQELVTLNTVRFKEGYIPEADLYKVRLEQVRFDNALAGALLTKRQAAVRLLELLGETTFEGAATLETDGTLQLQPVHVDLDRLRQATLKRNPEVGFATAELARARVEVRMQRAVASSEVIPYFGYRRVGMDNTIQAGVTLPLPFGNRNQVAIARSEAEAKVAETNLALARARALADLESAHAAHETARAQVVSYESGLLRQAAELHKIATKAYREGVWDLVALLEAQRTHSEMRASHARALFDYHVSIFQLELASGVDILNEQH